MKRKTNNLFVYFIYISIFFLIIALIKADYLKFPEIISNFYVILSILILFLGLILSGIEWSKILAINNRKIYLSDGLISTGLSIFGKYIPGKVWMILGKAQYISGKYGYPRKEVASLSLTAQFITLWIGLMLGGFGLFLIGGIRPYGSIILLLWVCLTIVLFTNFFHCLAQFGIKTILKKEIEIPRLEFFKTIKVLPWFSTKMFLLTIAFYFLIKSLYAGEANIVLSLAFPLAASLGIMAIFFPGGVGVREGILIGYLKLYGINITDATTIAVVSRLWFLLGEIFIFLLGLILLKTTSSIQKCWNGKNDAVFFKDKKEVPSEQGTSIWEKRSP